MTLEDLHQALRAHLIAPAVALPALTLPILRVMPGTRWIGYVYAGWGLGCVGSARLTSSIRR